jgi:hypothetical protein
MGVYAEVREFVLAHRPGAGPRQAHAGPPTVRVAIGFSRRLWMRGRVQTVGDAGRCGRGSAAFGAARVRELASPVPLLPRAEPYLLLPADPPILAFRAL